jgi:hypothetical protein
MNRANLLLLGVLGMNAVSCSGSDGNSGSGAFPCPFTSVTAHPLSGQITYVVGDRAPETHPFREFEGEVPLGECSARVSSFVTPETDVGVAAGSQVSVTCVAIEGTIVVFQAITAPWQLAPGARLDAVSSPESQISTRSCAGYGQIGSATVDVEQGEGGSAPYPTAVTSDYRRVYRVHIEGATDSQSGGRCLTMSVTIDAQFSESAADVVEHPDELCFSI